ncbi:hypothetical protein A5765_14275 [Mycolicibacterium celeriflavum]|uniref:hypothetical protein n=1 Tax=Mycolicibacterium celeriflavum TaxID=1249101 RepID=UPI0007FF8A26|nr:hypothetical protein [Mycolicibacterium celeriflavum]OBG12521.1 hypothetical protein A5765_14275 [Mycolicibacterium celeriflavum]
MVTTSGLRELLADVNAATKLLQRSATVPDEVAGVIDRVGSALEASPAQKEADPYLTAALWQAAYRAEKALRHDNAAERRRDVRIALEQFRHALRDITEEQPYIVDAPVRDVLARTVETLDAPQKDVAELLGVSIRQLQRWLAEGGSDPAADDAGRIRAVGRIVNQLRHTFTGPGVLAWFRRRHPTLGRAPIDMLGDPLQFPEVVRAATAARAMTA